MNKFQRPWLFKTFCGGLIAFFGISKSYGTVNVYFSTSSTSLQAEFIAQTTTQYVATVTQNPYFSNTYSMTITGKRNYTPPVVSSPVVNATAVDRCMTYGYVWGVESERQDNLNMLNSFRENVSVTSTCGGQTENSISVKDAYLEGCMTAYNHVTSTITQRNGQIPVLP